MSRYDHKIDKVPNDNIDKTSVFSFIFLLQIFICSIFTDYKRYPEESFSHSNPNIGWKETKTDGFTLPDGRSSLMD